MNVRAGTGWQYALADLSLILFLVTASALAQANSAPKAPSQPAPPAPIAAAFTSEPVAVWSAGEGAPPLAQWLAQVAADPRLEVQVIVRFADKKRDKAVAQAVQLVAEGGPRASGARILVEPGDRSGASVSLTYASEGFTPPATAVVTAALAR
jgi:hypothetical protein